MKKAEEYFVYMASDEDIIELYEDSKKDFIEAIKKAQIDAVEYAVKMCAKEAKLKTQKKFQYGKNNRGVTMKKGEEIDLFSYEMQSSVDKQSILNVANKIKEELNETN